MKKRNDLLFEQFKEFEISKQSAKINYGLSMTCTTYATVCTQSECGSDDSEWSVEDALC